MIQIHRTLSRRPKSLFELVSSFRDSSTNILESMTFGKYSADVAMPLLRVALLNAGAPVVLMPDLGKNCACSSLVGIIGPRGPA